MRRTEKDIPKVSLLPKGLFRLLIVLTIMAFALIWNIDRTSDLIIEFDSICYPFCILSLVIILGLSWRNIPILPLQLLSYLIIAGYLISSSIVHHQWHSHQELSSAVQWLPLNYVMAYLFFEKRRAIGLAISMLVICLVGHYWALIQYDSLAITLGMVANMAVAHTIYIIVLAGVVRIREDSFRIRYQSVMLSEQVLHDPLTGLLNRRGFMVRLNQLSASPDSRRITILMIDIDYFKQVNDHYGHIGGDRVLQVMGKMFYDTVHSDDFIVRWGGEEFVCVVNGYSSAQAVAFAESLRQSVIGLENKLGFAITVSVGVGMSGSIDEYEMLLHDADHYLYQAKKRGRNCVCSHL